MVLRRFIVTAWLPCVRFDALFLYAVLRRHDAATDVPIISPIAESLVSDRYINLLSSVSLMSLLRTASRTPRFLYETNDRLRIEVLFLHPAGDPDTFGGDPVAVLNVVFEKRGRAPSEKRKVEQNRRHVGGPRYKGLDGAKIAKDSSIRKGIGGGDVKVYDASAPTRCINSGRKHPVTGRLYPTSPFPGIPASLGLNFPAMEVFSCERPA